MARVAFIGLGNMGGGMAANQVKAGHEVIAFDLAQAALKKAVGQGCAAAASAAECVRDADLGALGNTCSANTWRTCGPAGSMVMTTSASLTHSAAEPAAAHPCPTAFSSAARDRSKAITS